MRKEEDYPSRPWADRVIKAVDELDSAVVEAFDLLDEAVWLLDMHLDADPRNDALGMATRAFLAKVRR